MPLAHVMPHSSSTAKTDIEDGAGEQHGDAPPGRTAREGARQLGGRDRRFALVQHLDVARQAAASRCTYSTWSAPADAFVERLAKAHREAQHLEAQAPRDPEVAELVHRDQQAYGDHEPVMRLSSAHSCVSALHRCISVMPRIRSRARTLPSRRPPERPPARRSRPRCRRCTTASMTAAMPGKFNRRSRKSLNRHLVGGVRAAPDDRPAPARGGLRQRRQRNVRGSGARKSRPPGLSRSRKFNRSDALAGARAWAIGVRMSGARAAPAPSRRCTRPGNARCLRMCTTISYTCWT